MTNPIKYKAVLYCDGGARPTNPGYAGYGIHGYVYSDKPTKKGIGKNNWMAGAEGYVKKTESPGVENVDVVAYIDRYATMPEICSNNLAEAQAAIDTITHTQSVVPDYKLSAMHIYTDNKGVVMASNELLERWEKLGWRKTNGDPLANVETMKKLLASIREFKSTAELKVSWIEAHNGHIGNEAADDLATIACLKRMRGEQGDHTTVSSVGDGSYWNPNHDRHALLFHKTMYFLTTAECVKPGEYFVGNHGKKDDQVIKQAADGYRGYVWLKDPIVLLEQIRQKQIEVCKGEMRVSLMHLDTVMSPDIYDTIHRHGTDCLAKLTPSRADLSCVPKTPVTRILEPFMIGYSAIENCSELKTLLEHLEAGNTEVFTPTDITDQFYKKVVKKGKKGSPDTEVTQLIDNFTPGQHGIAVKLKVKTKDELVETQATLGIDLPTRNALKKLETEDPKIYGVTWMEINAYRYAFVITTDTAKAVYCAWCTNLMMI